MINRLKFAYYFIKGKYLLTQNNLIEALIFFTKATRYNDDDYDLYAYKGLCEFFLKKFENAAISYQHALQLVEKKNVNDDEKSYLKHYILENLIDSLNILKKYENVKKYELILKNLEYNKNNVGQKLQKDFPF